MAALPPLPQGAVMNATATAPATGGASLPPLPPGATMNAAGAAPAPDAGPGFVTRMGDLFGGEVGAAGTALGSDISGMSSSDPRVNAASNLSLPVDAANTAFSLGTGLVKATAGNVVGTGLEAIQRTDRPEGYVPPYTDERGVKHPATVLTPDQLAEYKQHSASGAPNPYFKESRIRPRPFIRGTAEEIAGGVTDAVMDVASLAAPEGAERLLPKEAAAGVQVPKKAPTLGELNKYAKEQYKIADSSGMRISNQSLRDLHKKVADDLEEEHGYDDELHPKTKIALARLEAASKQNEPFMLKDMDKLRRKFLSAEKQGEQDDRRVTRVIKDHFDDFIDNLQSKDLTGAPRFPGDHATPVVVDQKAIQALKNARDAWKRKSKGELIENAFKKAHINSGTYSVAGYENALRTEFRKLARKDRVMARFTKEEQAAIEEVAVGGKLENALRFLGKFAVRGVGSAAVSIGGGEALGIGAGTLPIMGEAAKLGATWLTSRKAQEASELVRGGPKPPAPQKQPSKFPYLAGPASAAHVLGGDQQ